MSIVLSDAYPNRPDVRAKKNLIIGNPGISKSWLHYKLILFFVHPDLFISLWMNFLTTYPGYHHEVNRQGDLIPNMENLKIASATAMKFSDSTRKPPTTVDSELTILADLQGVNSLLWPDLVVRTKAGQKSWFFYIKEEMPTVFQVDDHTPNALDKLTNEDTMLLWEPDGEKTLVPS
jgi:hypothetical protein